jgi:hypothetical protein
MEALNLMAKPVPPRETAQVRFTNGKGAFEAPMGTILEEYVRAAYPDRWRVIVGAVIDGLRELFAHRSDCSVEPSVSSRDGTHLLASLGRSCHCRGAQLFPARQ